VTRLRAVAAAAALAMGLVAAPAAHASTPPRATGAVLTTGTRIEWTGVKGFRLRVPPGGAKIPPEYGALLTLRGGTYAGVRWTREATCDSPCAGVSVSLDYTRGLARSFFRGYPRGRDHNAWITNEGGLAAGVWDVYLFTDGAATLELDATGLPRQPRAWTASGRVRGTFRALPRTCGYSPCTAGDGYAGRAWTGGATGDVGRLGIADGFVAHYSTSPQWVPQSHSLRGCAYAEQPADTGDAATDHPLGCDAVENGGQSLWAYDYAVWGTPLYAGVIRDMGIHGAHGRVYLGFQVSNAHDLSAPEFEAYGLWYELGIT